MIDSVVFALTTVILSGNIHPIEDMVVMCDTESNKTGITSMECTVKNGDHVHSVISSTTKLPFSTDIEWMENEDWNFDLNGHKVKVSFGDEMDKVVITNARLGVVYMGEAKIFLQPTPEIPDDLFIEWL